MLAGTDLQAELSLEVSGLAAVLLGGPILLGILLEGVVLAATRRVDRRGLLVASLVVMSAGQGVVAWAPSAVAFTLALTAWGTASGLSTTLAEVGLVARTADADKAMTRWGLSGSIGDLVGPLLFALAAWLGLGWRGAIGVGAALGLANAVFVATGPRLVEAEDDEEARAPLAEVLGRPWLWAWTAAATACTLFDEVFVAFGSLRLREIGASPVLQGLAFSAFSAGMAGGQLAVERLLERFGALRILVAASVACLLTWPAWLCTSPGSPATTVACSAALGLCVAPMWSLCTSQSYGVGRNAAVVATLAHAFGFLDALIPVVLGGIADRFGMVAALVLLAAQPLVVGTVAVASFRKKQG